MTRCGGACRRALCCAGGCGRRPLGGALRTGARRRRGRAPCGARRVGPKGAQVWMASLAAAGFVDTWVPRHAGRGARCALTERCRYRVYHPVTLPCGTEAPAAVCLCACRHEPEATGGAGDVLERRNVCEGHELRLPPRLRGGARLQGSGCRVAHAPCRAAQVSEGLLARALVAADIRAHVRGVGRGRSAPLPRVRRERAHARAAQALITVP